MERRRRRSRCGWEDGLFTRDGKMVCSRGMGDCAIEGELRVGNSTQAIAGRWVDGWHRGRRCYYIDVVLGA